MAEASFFPRAEPLSVADIAALARIDLPHGACGTATISGAAPLETAGPDDLVYMDNAKYAEVLGSTRAGACLVSKRFAGRVPAGTVALVTPQPYEVVRPGACPSVPFGDAAPVGLRRCRRVARLLGPSDGPPRAQRDGRSRGR